MFLMMFGVTAPVESVLATSPFANILKVSFRNIPVLSVHATTLAASNGFDTPVPDFLASFAPLILLHTLTLLQ
jgi:hypothetical protein